MIGALRSMATAVKPLVVFVLGGPGAGKGTQCARMVKDFGFVHLSAGDLLRAERSSGSEDGTLIEDCIRNGKIVPVHITIRLLQKAMETNAVKKFLIDGFPRNKDNLEGWEKEMSGKANVKCVLFFDCSEQMGCTFPSDGMYAPLRWDVRSPQMGCTFPSDGMYAPLGWDVCSPQMGCTTNFFSFRACLDRAMKRGESSGRSDDNLESFKKRYHTYTSQTMPIIEHYEKKGLVKRIDAAPHPDTVFQQVAAIVKDF